MKSLKKVLRAVFVFLSVFLISSCSSPSEVAPSPIVLPSNTAELTSTFTATVQPSETPTQTPVPPSTATPLPTLEPKQAEEVIRALLQITEKDCLAPCFWGIIPGKTTLEEAESIFTHLGIQLIPICAECSEEFYTLAYDFDSGLSMTMSITTQDSIVESVKVNITSEKLILGKPREWLAYSPETLIRRYGTPSKAEFFIGMLDTPFRLHSMILYFDSVNLIVTYVDTRDSTDFLICPLTDQLNFGAKVWFGKNPLYPPLPAIPLGEATSLTLEEFAELMMGEPENACIDMKPYYSNR